MRLLLFFIVLLPALQAVGQNKGVPIEGEVTYTTSQNIYIKFDNTEKINAGDTIYLNSNPCLLVANKSSRSCVCTKIGDCAISIGQQVVYYPSGKRTAPRQVKSPETHEKTTIIRPKEDLPTEAAKRVEAVTGFVSVAGYGLYNDKRSTRNRFTARLSLNVSNIAGSKFSFSSYMYYRQNFIPDIAAEDRKTMFFNVYDLAVKFDASPKLKLLIGRSINPKMTSVGAIDGFQGEFTFGSSSIGLVAGTRPGIYDYSFDPSLLQYGGYYSFGTTDRSFYSTTTLGYIEQMNKNVTDRRYLYFQHSSSIMRNLYFFTSFEADLYKTVQGKPGSDFRLTNIYASLRYRFGRIVSVSVSYNNRRRIIYYETYHTEIEKLLDDDIARQGIRAGVRVTPVKNLSIGGSYGKRFQTNEQNKSDNIYGYVSLYNVGGGHLKASYTLNTSNYLKTQAGGLYYSKMLAKKLYGDFYYRFLNYNYFTRETSLTNSQLIQHYFGASLALYLPASITFSILGEYGHFIEENNYRFYIKLIKRFRSKKSK